MGLSQVIERPRNWMTPNHNFQDTLSLTQDARFFTIGSSDVNSNQNNRSIVFPYDITIHRMWIKIRTNGLDALSVNTVTLMNGGVASTDGIITLTDSSVAGIILQTSGFSETISAGDQQTFRWNSDSVGTVIVTTIGFSYRIVNPAV